MAIFKFYQVYRSINEELGEDMAIKIFPEYRTLPDKMPGHEQAQLAKVIMDRLDELIDEKTVIKIRQKHCCNIPKENIDIIKKLKEKCSNLDEICVEYSKFLSPGYVEKNGNQLTISFGWHRCVCGMFRKLETYETMPKTWCECCNGHVIKTFNMICNKTIESEIIEAVACGGKDCIFKINI
jgi:hypothetical protein